MQRKTQWTLVQHSGYGYAGNRGFKRGLETRSVNTAAEAKRVTNAGGILFDSYSKAEDLADAENGRGGTIYPRCGGSFSRHQVDGLAIWVPEPEQCPFFAYVIPHEWRHVDVNNREAMAPFRRQCTESIKHTGPHHYEGEGQ